MRRDERIEAVQVEFPRFSGRLYTACRRTPETGVTLCARARELAGLKKPEKRAKGIHWSIRVNEEQDALLKRRMDKLHYTSKQAYIESLLAKEAEKQLREEQKAKDTAYVREQDPFYREKLLKAAAKRNGVSKQEIEEYIKTGRKGHGQKG